MNILIPLLVALVVVPVSAEGETRPLELLQKGSAAAGAGEHGDAVKLLEAATIAAPDHPLPLLLLSRSALALGDVQQATTALEKAVALGAALQPEDLSEALPAGVRARLAETSRANREPINRSRVAAVLDDRYLIPESLAWDSLSGDLYVGSMYSRKIVRRAADGTVSDFVSSGANELWSVLGIKLDPVRRELWANSCNIGDSPPMKPADPETVGRGAIHRWSLDEARLIARYVPPASTRPICFNDLVVTGRGVFATTGGEGLWKVDPANGTIERAADLEGLLINGIAADERGDVLYLADAFIGPVSFHTETGEARRLERPSGAMTLGGIDGLYLHGDALIGIQNAASRVPPQVLRISLSDHRISGVEILERNHPLYDIPTTGAITGDALLYLANSQLRSFRDGAILPDGELEPTYILRLPLSADE